MYAALSLGRGAQVYVSCFSSEVWQVLQRNSNDMIRGNSVRDKNEGLGSQQGCE